MNIHASFMSWECQNQIIFLRADLNVPLVNGSIASDFRLRAIQPTLDALLAKKSIVILATHIGRPQHKEQTLSTKHLLSWFEQHGYFIEFCETIALAQQKSQSAKPGTVLLLENLRFFPYELSAEGSYLEELQQLAEWYVLDAFATAHRGDASLAPLATRFPKEKRSIGFLVEKELIALNKLLDNEKKPSLYILGGGKVSDKLPLIAHLVKKKVDTVLLCPALVFTFLKSQNKPVGKSLVDNDSLQKASNILIEAKESETTIAFPSDYQIALETKDGPLEQTSAANFPSNGLGVSIGDETIKRYSKYIDSAGTIFYNGMMGFPDRPETLRGVEKVFQKIAQSKGFSVIAGGESAFIVDKLNLQGIGFCSTGGGATLAYLAGKPLPALVPFRR